MPNSDQQRGVSDVLHLDWSLHATHVCGLRYDCGDRTRAIAETAPVAIEYGHTETRLTISFGAQHENERGDIDETDPIIERGPHSCGVTPHSTIHRGGTVNPVLDTDLGHHAVSSELQADGESLAAFPPEFRTSKYAS
ncbi:hypothetical protein [Aporhodopirellula rubra]|uniref:hypothetical protein n=1 Tax=Aporhodopirellula rubra TaxID=980271 RepID=UPI00161DB532|nr:hypothetical protein [Aporhodopirellula rubra]